MRYNISVVYMHFVNAGSHDLPIGFFPENTHHTPVHEYWTGLCEVQGFGRQYAILLSSTYVQIMD